MDRANGVMDMAMCQMLRIPIHSLSSSDRNFRGRNELKGRDVWLPASNVVGEKTFVLSTDLSPEEEMAFFVLHADGVRNLISLREAYTLWANELLRIRIKMRS
ncbi:hypothetical protein NPIL_662451 [Nephila pilipes]|uniref:Uncharacterized protein n=1 Tax=Nephila pilipes TaxID=299642 RepID=A0A8X6UGW3_NEPPI|nr:hypothetical protein NPIL_662451 [Nephila pilipes]